MLSNAVQEQLLQHCEPTYYQQQTVAAYVSRALRTCTKNKPGRNRRHAHTV